MFHLLIFMEKGGIGMRKNINKLDLSIILPTYNERKNILDLILNIKEELNGKPITYECIVVDDDSPDGTYEAVRNRFKQEKEIKVTNRKKDPGLGQSILEGLKQAKGENIVVMDTDFNHDPKMIWQMYHLLKFYDVVIGSRFVYSGGMEDRLRNKFSFLYNLFVRVLLGTHIQDNLSGYFATNMKILKPFLKKEIFSGYGEYFLRLLYRMTLNKTRIIEVPVYYLLRRHGVSKSYLYKMILTYTKTILLELRWEAKRKSLGALFNR